MLKLPQRDTKALLAIHGWSGILLGLLLYTVICTGVAAVFAEEINDWASPLPHADMVGFPPGLDATVRSLAQQVEPQYLEEIAVFRAAGGRVNLRFHRDAVDPRGKPSERGVEFELDPVGWHTLARRSGWEEEIAAQTHASAVADFLVSLHVRLHIPDPYGLFVTGILGLAMMVAAVTGLLMHRHLLVDLFTLRRGRDALLRRRDLHVIAASWNLPFAFVLAFTGSFFSFADSVGVPAMALVRFGGDQQQLTETLYGTARTENKAPARLDDISAMLADSRRRANAEPDYLSIAHYGRADATVTVSTALPRDTLVYSSYLYDGADGRFLREVPPLGRQPSAGASLVGLMYPLHFGNFAGAVSKSLWVALGLGAAYVTFTGMLLWIRRREEQFGWRRMARPVLFVGYGLPLALACAPYAFFILRGIDGVAVTRLDAAFLLAAAVVAVTAFLIRDLARLRRVLLSGLALALCGLPAIRLLTGGPGWIRSWNTGILIVPAVDLALLIFGSLCLWAATKRLPVTP